MLSKVVITGIGFISSIGNDRAEVTESLRELKHGIEIFPPLLIEKSPVCLAGTIKEFETSSKDAEDWSYPPIYKIRRDVLRSMGPNGLFGYCALTQAIREAELRPEDISNEETGLYTASGGSIGLLHYYLNQMETRGVMRCSPMGIVSSVAGTLTFNLAAAFKILGASCGFVSACASSGHALGFARDEIALGRQKRMFVVGAEDCNLESILPFAGMRTLSVSKDPNNASRPFDRDRDGFVGTGGGVAVVLEEEKVARKRNAPIYGEFLSWGQASDGHNVAISHPEGNGLALAMKRALNNAGLAPEAIDYLNAHATSTAIGDRSEIRAIKKVFKGPGPAISSTKALSGHALSMASILEAGLCLLAIKEGFMPGSAHITHLDTEAEGLFIPRETLSKTPSIVMSNSSGFGGANVSLLFKAYESN